MTDKNQKLEKVVKMLVVSEAMKQVMEFSVEEWMGIMKNAGEEQMNDLLLILDEEQDGYADIENEKERKKKVNMTRFLQHVEKLKFEHDKLEHKPKTNGK